MKPEIRDAWADALESGAYAQGKSVLTRVKNDGTVEHCCLGVLCDLAVKAGATQRIDTREVQDGNCVVYGTGSDRSSGTLPASVMDWAGLERYNPMFTYEDYTEVASYWNDRDENLTFPEIAKLIREQL